MTKSEAIKQTLSECTELYRFGNQWRFNYYVSTYNAWRESQPTDYWKACEHRKSYLIMEARTKLYGDIGDVRTMEMDDFSEHPWKWYV